MFGFRWSALSPHRLAEYGNANEEYDLTCGLFKLFIDCLRPKDFLMFNLLSTLGVWSSAKLSRLSRVIGKKLKNNKKEQL